MKAMQSAVAGATEKVATATQQAAAAAVRVATATENGIMFDAIAAVRKMVDAGIDRLPAECIAGLVNDTYRITRAIVVDELDRRQFATKADLSALEKDLTDKLSAVEKELTGKLSALRTELTDKLSALRTELTDRLSAVEKELAEVSALARNAATKADLAAMKTDLAAMQNRLLLWMGGGLIAVVGILASLMGLFHAGGGG